MDTRYNAPALLPEHLLPMPREVLGLRSGGLRRYGQWLAFVGFEVLAHGRFG